MCDEPSSLAALVLELQGGVRYAILVMQQFLDLLPHRPRITDRDVVHVDVPLKHRLSIAELPDMDMVQILDVRQCTDIGSQPRQLQPLRGPLHQNAACFADDREPVSYTHLRAHET